MTTEQTLLAEEDLAAVESSGKSSYTDLPGVKLMFFGNVLNIYVFCMRRF